MVGTFEANLAFGMAAVRSLGGAGLPQELGLVVCSYARQPPRTTGAPVRPEGRHVIELTWTCPVLFVENLLPHQHAERSLRRWDRCRRKLLEGAYLVRSVPPSLHLRHLAGRSLLVVLSYPASRGHCGAWTRRMLLRQRSAERVAAVERLLRAREGRELKRFLYG